MPEELALKIRAAFPHGATTRIRESLRELKYVAAQMDAYDPILEEALYAFEDPRLVALVGRVTGCASCVLTTDCMPGASR